MPHIFLPREGCLIVEWWDGTSEAEKFDFQECTVDIRKRMEEFDRRVESLKKVKTQRPARKKLLRSKGASHVSGRGIHELGSYKNSRGDNVLSLRD